MERPEKEFKYWWEVKKIVDETLKDLDWQKNREERACELEEALEKAKENPKETAMELTKEWAAGRR
ncbi:hypothetical protein EJ04DRAFT_517511 [Polyplosphaeria fusca]|uniref:Uncharacterized protein n=1 Tax=Polyplosphaeria fusca TaxID=682080 RepID=A0A9P4USR2_9PLEO|nr:hypothetical protein EJ04DRAFT_517511 [Polyplosphaeria fusca]